MKKINSKALVPHEVIENKIILLRGKRVMLDKDLAVLYEVETRDLNKAVNRNLERFPSDFMFRLTQKEYKNLMFHFGTSSWGGTRKPPYVFTEQGVAMLSSVLRSKRAIQVNIAIMRVFVKLKQFISTHRQLANKLVELEKRMGEKDQQIISIFAAIRELMSPERKTIRVIKGFSKK
jgi:hypothetical protein